MEDFLKAIANFGFPIVVAVYLLIRMEKTLGNLKEEIRNLQEVIDDLCHKISK